MIKNRVMTTYITKEEWRLLQYPIKTESRAKFLRWKLTDVSECGSMIHLEITLFGSFWKELDDIFSTYIEDWEDGGYVVPLF